MTTKRIWITGIAGFLGSHIADACEAEGYEVEGNDNLICGSLDNHQDFINIDCCDQKTMLFHMQSFSPDTVIHCAATAHEGLSSFSPSFITKNIYEASVATFSAAIASGAKHIIYMSSMSRYGDGGELGAPFREDYPTMPVDPYGIAKVAAEETLKVLCRTHKVKYTILVPHNIIGVRQRYVDPYRNVAAIMINRCKQGKAPIIYGDGQQMRCFSPISDCIPSIMNAIQEFGMGEVINIGPDKGHMTINKLCSMIKDLCGVERPTIYYEARPNEVRHAYTNSNKARALLGYTEVQPVEQCIKEMVHWIQPKPFIYNFDIEIKTDRTPKTWLREEM